MSFDLKLKVHTSLIGTTGYNNHAQSFFRALSEHVPLEIRNFTIGRSWSGHSDEPHNGEDYVDAQLKTLMTEQTLWNDSREMEDHPIYQNWPNPGKPVIDLVLNETDHHYFYRKYSTGYKIAFNVWESTLQPQGFFNKLLEFNELWVPSKWQRDCSIKQGYPTDRVFVIPEGVDTTVFFPEKAEHLMTSNPKRFTFALFGRWDYRKSTKEIIETFLKTFSKKEPVDLIVSIDNPFSGDSLKTTEARLGHYDLLDSRIKIMHLPPREDYVKIMKSANVFLSCARSEGWNLPLIEAMACGTVSIYSNCSAQLEFAEGRGLPVKIVGERPASDSSYNHFNTTVGTYYEPDFDDLAKVMRDAYENYANHKERALIEAKEIHDLFNWERVAKLASDHLESRQDRIREVIRMNPNRLKITYHFVDGPHVDITGGEPSQFRVEFIDQRTGNVEYSKVVPNGNWVAGGKKYFVDWLVQVTDTKTNEILLSETINLKGARVYVAMDSNSIGDTIAWIPYVDSFRMKHGCKMICSTFHNSWFKKTYPEIEFVEPGTTVDSLFAMYNFGWYYNDDGTVNLNKNPTDMKLGPLQKTASDILGLDFVEILPKLIQPVVKKKKQVAIAIHGTSQSKYWNRAKGWQDVIDWCNANGYEAVIVSKEDPGYMKNPHPTGARKLPVGPIDKVMKEIKASKAFVGIGSGLSWIAWAMEVPIVLVSGFSYDYTEMQTNTRRVGAPEGKCSGCFNRYKLNAGDWNWCPDHKGTQRAYECSRSITSESVIAELKSILGVV